MANQPSFIPSAWAANNSTTETIPATTTESGKASWDQGFPVETSLPLSEGGIPPKYGDFNGILNVLSQFCLFAQAGGQFTWLSTLSYSVGSIVVGSDGSIYRAVQATTNVNPVGDTSGKWERIVSQSDIAALESDIQTAMTNASDAVSNASAAQSAVSTLDANVVKLSGDQTVGGTKTFSDTIVESNDTASMKRPNTMGALRMTGGTNTSDTGALLSLFGADNSNQAGYFRVYAVKDANTATLLEGRPDGTLTWGGKGFVYDSGNQTIAGTKTFSSTIAGSINGNAETATKLGTATKGGANQPIYLNAGAPTACNTMVATTGDQTIAGTKTFSADVPIKLTANEAFIRKELNGQPSSQRTIGVSLFDTQANNSKSWTEWWWTSTNTSCQHGISNIYSNTAAYYALRTHSSSVNYLEPVNSSIWLGRNTSGYKWEGIYLNASAINTSDERLKDNITAIPDAVLDAWGDVQWSQYQFKVSVAEKGMDNARLHTGAIAQRIDDVFKAHGLDASRYGLWCYDHWNAEPEERDDKGNVITPAREASDAYAIRYEEALCVEAAYQRRRADRAEARISALERRLNEMEAAIASLISHVGDESYEQDEVTE